MSIFSRGSQNYFDLINVTYTNTTKNDFEITDANLPSDNLNVIGLNIGVNRTFNDTWSATFMLFSKLASDATKISSDNHQLALLSLVTKKKCSNLKYRYGVYVNTEKYGLIVVPIFGLYYKSANKKFEANLNLPIIGDINYEIGKKSLGWYAV